MAGPGREKRRELRSALLAGCSLEEFQSAVGEEDRMLFVRDDDTLVLRTALLIGRFDIADWIMDHFEIDACELYGSSRIGELLSVAAGRGRLDACRWINSRFDRSEFLYDDFDVAMYEAMYYKQDEIVKWLHTVYRYQPMILAMCEYKIKRGLDKRCHCHDNCT